MWLERTLAPLVIAALLFCLPAPCWAWTGKVIGVADGDTITVLHNGQPEKIRLWGIDCPEKNQDFGTKAKHITSILVFAKMVEVEPVTGDRYRRTVALVKAGDTVLNEELVRQRLAQVFIRYCATGPSASAGSTAKPRPDRRDGASGPCRMPYRPGSSGGG
jgi:micrococcal nuclease